MMGRPGRYQCSVTGLRWEGSCDVELEYCLSDWDQFSEFLEKRRFIPCGPLMNIRVISGELTAVYVPHFLCLGSTGFTPSSDVRVLGWEDAGVCLESCELSRFHAILPNPKFLSKGVVVRCGFPLKVHCDVLIYRTAHLTLHVYLVPWDLTMKESVEKREKNSVKISEPGTNFPLQMENHYKLRTTCSSQISPQNLQLIYTSQTPDFFEVYIEDAKEGFQLNLLTEKNETEWMVYIQPDEISRNPGDVDTLRGATSSSGTQRICNSCSIIKDSTDWVVLQPEAVALLANESKKYRITAAPGRYECGVTGVRWESTCEVELEYFWSNWDLVSGGLERLRYQPCGPLLDVTVISGKLEAVHLPHFLCLGSKLPLGDAVRVSHVTDDGVSLETCTLTPFHATLLHPTFSSKGVVVKKGFRGKVHCRILIYHVLASPQTLHIYLIPDDSKIKEDVEKEEKGKSVKISKPDPVSSLQMNKWYKLTTSDCDSEITPKRLQLRNTTDTPNFFEVYVSNPTEDFNLQMLMEHNKEIVWEVKIREGDLKNAILEKTHCKILIYRILAAPLKLHIYLIPDDLKMKEDVEKEERGKGVKISKPNPELKLQMRKWYKLKTSDCDSEITPKRLQLRYTTSTPNFFEVYISNPTEDFNLQMLTEHNNEIVWEVKIREDDFSEVCRSEDDCFVDRHMNQLIQRVTLVDPIADYLKSFLGDEKYSIIQSKSTSQDKMRELYSFLSGGEEIKRKFYESLQKFEPCLCNDLQKREDS